MTEKTDKSDLEFLLQRGEFLRFLLRVIQTAGIFNSTTDGSESRHLFLEGRRKLGLEILEMAEAAQPQAAAPDIPAMTLLQVLLEEAKKPQPEKPNGRRNHDRYDRSDDLRDDGDNGDDDSG